MALLINGERIEENAIQAEANRIEQSRQQSGESGSVPTSPREQALDRLIGQTLLRRAARKSVDVSETEVKEEFDRLVNACGGIEGFRQRYGVSASEDERFKKHLLEGMRLDRLIEKSEVDLTVGEDELAQYYAVHFDDFMSPEEIRASHIVRNPQKGHADEIYSAMCEARKKLLGGADFAAVANEYSECQSEPGGDLGFFAKGQMVEGFEAVVFSMDVGEVSPVFLTQFGFHIAKVTDKRSARRRAFDEVRGRIVQIIRNARREEAIRSLVEQLRAKADIREVPDTPSRGNNKKANR